MLYLIKLCSKILCLISPFDCCVMEELAYKNSNNAFTPVQGIILSYRHEEGNPFKLDITANEQIPSTTIFHNLVFAAADGKYVLLVLLAVFVKHFQKN